MNVPKIMEFFKENEAIFFIKLFYSVIFGFVSSFPFQRLYVFIWVFINSKRNIFHFAKCAVSLIPWLLWMTI